MIQSICRQFNDVVTFVDVVSDTEIQIDEIDVVELIENLILAKIHDDRDQIEVTLFLFIFICSQ